MRKTNWNFLFALSLVLAFGLTGLALWRAQVALAPVEIPVLKRGTATDYARLAQSFAQEKNFAIAAQLNQQALTYHPGSAVLHYNQAWLAARQSQWQAALSEANQSLKLQADAQTYVLRAWIYQQQDQTSRFRQDLEHAKKLNWRPESKLEQARFLQLEDRHQAALKIYDQLISEGESAELYFWRSESHEALGQDQEALDDLSQWLSQHPQADGYLRHAQLNLKLGDLQAAFADYQQSLKQATDSEVQKQRDLLWIVLDPKVALAEFMSRQASLEQKLAVVRAQLELKETKTAQQALDELLKENPRQAEVHFLQARSFRLRRKYTDASQALQLARSLKHDQSELLLEEARLLAQQGQKQAAEARVLQLLKAAPQLHGLLQQDRLLRAWVK